MEEISLIANSGIQFYNCRLDLNLNGANSKMFHEWFDESEINHNLEFAFMLPDNQTVYKLSDMEQYGFVDDNMKLIVPEDEVLVLPNLKPLERNEDEMSYLFEMGLNNCRTIFQCFENQWLPIPYFETGKHQGPYDWVRCKLIPRESKKNSILCYDMLVAYDTRTIYQNKVHTDCLCFGTELDKRFRLSGRASDLFDFCSKQNSWVKWYLMKLVHGVDDIDDVPFNPQEDQYRYSYLAAYCLLIQFLDKNKILPTIRIIRDRGVNHINEQMIIDIGNSRTAALLFEDGDFKKVKPLQLQNFTFPITNNGKLNKTHESFDMRVAFQKVSFGDITKQERENDCQFVWPSLVRLGVEANYLTHETTGQAEGNEILSTYSSPKRYLWDYKPRQEEWRCVTSTNGINEMPKITGINGGENTNFFNNDGSLNSEGKGRGLHYSRRTLMTLAFMEIITQAQVQINSYDFREFHGNKHTPRRIEKIILTCPTAMSKNEQQSLHDCLEEALLVLNKFNSSVDASAIPLKIKVIPELLKKVTNPKWIFDEATCSQFVYLYGEFSETYLNNSKEYFNLYGKKRPNEDGELVDSIIIGSFDIGAGTSDLTVCRYEYDDTNPARLKPIPKFWDSFNFAGDDMMKVLIENVLLQGQYGIIEQELAKRGKEDAEIRDLLYNFFGSDHNNLSFNDRILRRDFNLQICIPIMNYFLDLLSKDVQYRSVSFDELFAENKPSIMVLERFKDHFGFSIEEIRWTYDSNLMSSIIERTMNDMLENVGTIMYGEDCDLVIISGRPSSLPPIKNLMLRYLETDNRLDASRLIVLNKHNVGRWYPYVDASGYLNDSKSVVPVGAMIGYLASNAGGIKGFSLDLSALGALLKPTTDYFVLNNGQIHNADCFITPDDDLGGFVANSLPVYIGCKQFDFPSYPVRPFYVLDFDTNSIVDNLTKQVQQKEPGKTFTDAEKQEMIRQYIDAKLEKLPMEFTIERKDYENDKEVLRISSVIGNDNSNLSKTDFNLTVQSLNDPDCYWIDSGAFNINIIARQNN